jgi:MoxR-like ATPase
MSGEIAAEVDRLGESLKTLGSEMGKVVVGQEEVVEALLVTLLAGGHCLLQGVPGLAKTLMVRTLAEALDLSFHRIQFTPDLMPSDIVGTEILEEDHGTGRRVFKFNRGPVFANLVLADEINRSPPKTQAALLEAMQEQEVTYGSTTHPLPRPFLVLATQNPIEQAGTYPLPEAQLDRFLMLVRVEYPSAAEEVEILRRTTGEPTEPIQSIMELASICRAQELTRQVFVSSTLLDYATRLVRATRPASSEVPAVSKHVEWGAGPRAGQALILAAKGRALLHGRLAVTLEDLKILLAPVLRHRIVLGFEAQAEGLDSDQLVADLLDAVAAPSSPL